MPKNTRVYRCVKAVHKGTNKKGKPRYSYGDAIAICKHQPSKIIERENA